MADGGDRNDPARTDDSAGFPERGHSVFPLGQVVQGTEQQHNIDTVIGSGEVAGIAQLGHYAEVAKNSIGLGHMSRGDVDDPYLVVILGQPAGMDAGRSAHVENPRRRFREMTTEYLLDSQQFQLGEPIGDTVLLLDGLVVAYHRVVSGPHGCQRYDAR